MSTKKLKGDTTILPVAEKFADKGSERMVLSCVLNVPDLLIDVTSRLAERDFLSDNHRALYSILASLYGRGVKTFDIMAVVNEATDKGMLKLVGGAEYIDALMYNPVNPANLDVYLLKVLECSTKYKLYRRTETIQANILANIGSMDDAEPADMLIAQAETSILEVSMEAKQVEDAHNLADGLEAVLKSKQENPVDVMGLSSNIELLDKSINGFTPGSLTVVAARQKGGKCLSGDSLVLDTKTGELKPIKSFSGKSATFEGGKFYSRNVYGPISNGFKTVYEVSTRSGLKMKVTNNHPFLHSSGWADINSGKIQQGQHIAVASDLPFFGTEDLPSEDVKLLAYWLSEGSRGGRHISATNPEIIHDILEALEKIGAAGNELGGAVRTKSTQDRRDSFISYLDLREKITSYCKVNNTTRKEMSSLAGITPTTLHNTQHNGLCTEGTFKKLEKLDPVLFNYDEDFSSFLSGNLLKNPVQKLLEGYGVNVNSYSYEKVIPKCVFRLNKEKLSLFLNRLYSGDGWVTKREIGYSTSSSEMADQIKALLLRFGIVAYKRKKSTSRRDNYCLTIRKGRWMRRFINDIGCLGRQKQINSIADSLNTRKDSDTFGNPPKGLQKKLMLSLGNLGLSFSSLSKILGFTVRDGRNLSTHNFNQVARYIGDRELESLSTSSIFWDEIVSVKEMGVEEVFDIQITDGEPNFVANGFVVHNSTLLLNWATHIAFTQGIPVLYIDTELSTAEVQMRAVSHLSQVPERLVTNGKYIENEQLTSNVWRAHAVMGKGQLFHKYMPGFSMDAVKSMVRKYHAREGIGAFFFDYIKLPEVSGNDAFKEHQILGNIATGLKDLAGQLNIPVIAAAQIKRGDSANPKTRFHDSDVADSDRIGRFCTNLLAIGQKTKKEIEEDGLTCGTHRLQVLLARSGTPNYYGIDMHCNLPTLTMKQAEHQAYLLATAEQVGH